MGLETLFAMGGVLMMLGGLGMWSHSRQRVRGTRGRLFRAEVAPIPSKRAGQP